MLSGIKTRERTSTPKKRGKKEASKEKLTES